MLLLDTSTLIYHSLAPQRVGESARQAIASAEEGELCCSSISLWEITMLVEQGRLDPGTDALSFIRLVQTAYDVRVLPITPEIAYRAALLKIHVDHADRIIVATAIEHAAILTTADQNLLAAPDVLTLW